MPTGQFTGSRQLLVVAGTSYLLTRRTSAARVGHFFGGEPMTVHSSTIPWTPEVGVGWRDRGGADIISRRSQASGNNDRPRGGIASPHSVGRYGVVVAVTV